MVVGIIGLGLMGASFARTLKKQGGYTVYGIDQSADVMRKAELLCAVDAPLTKEKAKEVDLLVFALYPRAFLSTAQQWVPHLKEGAIVTDFCGNKRIVLSAMQSLQNLRPDLHFAGGHPMAGREYSGIEHAVTTLFEKASMILVPLTSNVSKLDWLKKFYLSVGFGEVVFTTAEHHDSMIAYTSQLCHIVSNAFIKNQSAEKHCGYSAGSYRDLTRVARLNGKMWTELLMDNRDMLSKELDELIFHLTEYKNALQENDENKLLDLLESGNNRKLKIDSRKKSNDNPDG